MAILQELNNGSQRFSVDDAGAVRINDAYSFPTVVSTGNNYVLKSDTSGVLTWAADGGGTVTGSGTGQKVPKWDGSGAGKTALTDGPITFSGDDSTFAGEVAIRSDQGANNNAVLRLRGQNTTNRITRLQFEDYSGALADGLIQFRVPTSGVASSALLEIGINSAGLTIDHSNNATFVGNIGLGMTPDTSWGTNSHIINIGIANADAGHIGWLEQAGADILTVGWNVYHNNTDWYYASNNPANLYTQGNGTHVFQVAASGTADNTITWTNALTIDSDGDSTFSGTVGIGTTGVYSTDRDLNLSGKGISIKNNIAGSNNNWSYIHNTATLSSSNLVFQTGNAAALILSHDGDANFAGNLGFPNSNLSSTAPPTNFGVYNSEVRLIDTPNGGLKSCRVITDNYGEWILVGRFAANAMDKIQTVWSSETGLDTSTAQDNVTRFSADFGDSYPTEVRIMGATDFTKWRDTRTIDFVYGVPEGRQWKFFFSGGVENGMAASTKYGWAINGSYDGFGRWVNPAQNFVRMSDTSNAILNPSAAYTTATTNAFNWHTNLDAKISVSATRVFSGQDTFVTAGFGADDYRPGPIPPASGHKGFFDDYPSESTDMQGGIDFTSAVWVLIKLPNASSGGGGGGGYWAADGNNIFNTNSANVGVGLSDPDSRLDINAGVLNIIAGPAVRISKGASPAGLIRYDTLVIEANDVPTIRFAESDGTVSTIMSGDSNMRINSTSPINFYTAGTATGEGHNGQGGTFAMVIDNSQNVGIGTSGPQTKLHVDGANFNTSSITEFKITDHGNNTNLNDVQSVIRMNGRYWSGDDNTAVTTEIRSLKGAVSGTTGSIMSFAVQASGGSTDISGNEAMRIVSSGKIGIGTTLPGALLQVGNGTVPSSTDQQGAHVYGYDGALSLYTTRQGESPFNAALYLYNNPAAGTGTGTGILFRAKTGGGGGSEFTQGRIQGAVYTSWTTNTDATRTSKMVFRTTDSASTTDKVTILGNGNVGIGETSPGAKIDIKGVSGNPATSGTTQNGILRIQNASNNNTLDIGQITSSPNGTWLQAADKTDLNPVYTYPLLLNPLGGNVGIGTVSPNYQLDIENSSHAVLRIHAGTNSSASLRLKNDAQDWDVNTQTNDTFAIYNQTSATQPFSILPNGNVGIGDTVVPNKLSVKDTTGNLICRFTPSSNHFSLIQTNTDATVIFSANHGNTGSENRFIWQTTGGTAKMKLDSGTLTVSADVIAFGSPSDKRLKENIKPIESALDKVSKLQGVTFDWIQKEDKILDIKQDIGFIAQDVQKVIPELVRENDNGMLSMRHQGIAPILIEAIKELKQEIEELKNKPCNCK